MNFLNLIAGGRSANANGGFATVAPGSPEASPVVTPSPANVYAAGGELHDALPSRAREKYLAMRDEAHELHLLTWPLREEIDEARNKVLGAESHLRRVMENQSVRMGGGENHPSAVQARQAVERLRAEQARAQARYDARVADWGPRRAITSALEDYLKANRGARLERASNLPEVKLEAGESYSQAVERVRGNITALKEDAGAVEDAPWSSIGAKQRVRKQIDALAESGKPNIWPLLESELGEIKFPTTRGVIHHGAAAGSVAVGIGDGVGLVAWLFRDEILARIEREIDANADDANALTGDERKTKHAEIASAILRAECEEEALVEAAARANVTIHRRRDADPRAVLGLSDSAPAPRK